MGFRYGPDWWAVTLAGVVLDLVGEVGDQLGSLGQIGPPDGLGMERFWYAGEPGQRTWADTRDPTWLTSGRSGVEMVLG